MIADAEFWDRAAREGLPWFRFLRRSVPVERLDREFAGRHEWESLKARMEPGDKIWPFCFHVRSYLGMRSGYVVLRRGTPIGGFVTIVS